MNGISFILLSVVAIVGVIFLLRSAKKSRRKKLRSLPITSEWKTILENNIPIYRILPNDLKQQLHGHIQVFVHKKSFEGCGGLAVTEEMKVTIAAQACILLLNRKPTYYPKLFSILIYPAAFIARNVPNQDGLIQDEAVHLGESWHSGAVIVSWDEALHGTHDPRDGYNVVLHEFAHQLDQEDGIADGTPILEERSRYLSWARVLSEEFQHLQEKAYHGGSTLLDHYGATNPAEFFAVATETFFEKPLHLKRRHPALYEELKGYYRVDPATWS